MAKTKNVPPDSLEQHLSRLRERMLHPVAYEKALDYFLSVVANDPDLTPRSERADSPGLQLMLGAVLSGMLGPGTKLSALVLLHVPQLDFDHGCARVGGRAMAFCYCRRLNVGIMGLIPGLSGPTEVARFRLAGSPDPAASN